MTSPKKAPANVPTPDQQEAFALYVQQWQDELGLQGWRIERSRRKTKNMAEVEIHHKAQLATYRIGDFGGTAITPESLESTALHELLHVMLYGLVNQVTIELTGEALEAEEHRVIHTLERLLMRLRKD